MVKCSSFEENCITESVIDNNRSVLSWSIDSWPGHDYFDLFKSSHNKMRLTHYKMIAQYVENDCNHSMKSRLVEFSNSIEKCENSYPEPRCTPILFSFLPYWFDTCNSPHPLPGHFWSVNSTSSARHVSREYVHCL